MPDYVGSARRDPDGSAIRLSLARRVTVNTMTAGERVFVDFLPDSWTGPPPSLPLDVIRELAERARAAERALRLQLAVAAAKKRPPVRVRASVQPTFVRFVFEMPDGVSVSSVLNDQKLTLAVQHRAQFRPGGCQGGGAAEHRLDQPEGRRRLHRGRNHADRRGRRAFLPRGEELRHRRRLPAGGKAAARASPAAKPAAASRAGACRAMARTAPARRRRAAPGIREMPRGAVGADCRRPTSRSSRAPPKMPAARQPRKRRPPDVADRAPTSAEHRRRRTAPKISRRRRKCAKPAPAAKETAGREAPKPPPKHGAGRGRNRRPPAPKPAAAVRPRRRPTSAAAVEAIAISDGLRLTFSFAAPTPGGAVPPRRYGVAGVRFHKADRCRADPRQGRLHHRRRQPLPLEKGQAIRIRLNRPQMPSLSGEERPTAPTGR